MGAACQLALAVCCWSYVRLPKNMVWLVLLIAPLHAFGLTATWSASLEDARNSVGSASKVHTTFCNSLVLGSVLWGAVLERPPLGVGFTRGFELNAGVLAAWSVAWQVTLVPLPLFAQPAE